MTLLMAVYFATNHRRSACHTCHTVGLIVRKITSVKGLEMTARSATQKKGSVWNPYLNVVTRATMTMNVKGAKMAADTVTKAAAHR
jgi:hypothetical protein